MPRDLPIAQALHVMDTRQGRRLPVVKNGRLVSMISLGDIAKAQIPEVEKAKTLESVSAAAADYCPGADLPEA